MRVYFLTENFVECRNAVLPCVIILKAGEVPGDATRNHRRVRKVELKKVQQADERWRKIERIWLIEERPRSKSSSYRELCGLRLLLLRRPVQRERGDEEEEKNDDPQIREEEKDDVTQVLLIHPKEMRHPPGSGLPEGQRRAEEEEGDDNPEDEHAQE